MTALMSETVANTTVEQQHPGRPLNQWEVTCSVIAAGFGVQSKDNKVRDFSRGKPQQFIIAGLLFTAAFIVSLVALISLIV